MATERLEHEVQVGDLPRIDLGNFNWQPVDRVFAAQGREIAPAAEAKASQQPIAQQLLDRPELQPATPLTEKEFPLNLLQNRTFAGTGYNTIWRPRSNNPIRPAVGGGSPDVLELNLTAETMAFSGSLGDVPNRGVSAQADLMLKGISYVQRVGAFENIETGLSNSKKPAGIHFEPGCLMFVPGSDSNPQGHPPTINRMASIPHGTTINAQGLVPNTKQVKGAPEIKATNIVPFGLNSPTSPIPGFPHLNFDGKVQDGQDRLPDPLNIFKDKGGITPEMFKDPNDVLRKALKGQEIDSFVTFELTTNPTVSTPPAKTDDKFLGGGTANIGFLQGTPQQISQGQGNAHAVKMTVRYWIETVGKTLTIEPNKPGQQRPTKLRQVSQAGVLGPEFVVPLSAKHTQPVKKRVTWTQVQYSQNVTLNFNGLSWPHISVATLGDTSTIELKDL